MMHSYITEMTMAKSYALANTDLAILYTRLALNSAMQMQRPDLVSEANEWLSVLKRFA